MRRRRLRRRWGRGAEVRILHPTAALLANRLVLRDDVDAASRTPHRGVEVCHNNARIPIDTIAIGKLRANPMRVVVEPTRWRIELEARRCSVSNHLRALHCETMRSGIERLLG